MDREEKILCCILVAAALFACVLSVMGGHDSGKASAVKECVTVETAAPVSVNATFANTAAAAKAVEKAKATERLRVENPLGMMKVTGEYLVQVDGYYLQAEEDYISLNTHIAKNKAEEYCVGYMTPIKDNVATIYLESETGAMVSVGPVKPVEISSAAETIIGVGDEKKELTLIPMQHVGNTFKMLQCEGEARDVIFLGYCNNVLVHLESGQVAIVPKSVYRDVQVFDTEFAKARLHAIDTSGNGYDFDDFQNLAANQVYTVFHVDENFDLMHFRTFADSRCYARDDTRAEVTLSGAAIDDEKTKFDLSSVAPGLYAIKDGGIINIY